MDAETITTMDILERATGVSRSMLIRRAVAHYAELMKSEQFQQETRKALIEMLDAPARAERKKPKK